MELIKPQKYVARVSEKYYLTENQRFLYVKLELVVPDRIKFRAGQYVSLKVGEAGERRSYSIASTPDDYHGIHLLVEILPEGKGSGYLVQTPIGGEVEILAPLGRFVDAGETGRSKRLFVATGSGIVPIWSMINDLLLNQRVTSPVRLHWGMRSETELFWMDNLERLAEAHPNFVYDVVLSRPSADWELCSGHVQDCLKRDFAQAENNLSEWQGYVCGNKEMVGEVSLLLSQLGMKHEQIYHEKFN